MDSNNVSDAARVGLKVTRTALRLSARLAARAVGGAIKVAQARAASRKSSPTPVPSGPAASVSRAPSASVSTAPSASVSTAPSASVSTPPSANGAQPAPAAPAAPPALPDPVVAESADAGAEAGAGAEPHVEAPWEGYDAQNVEAVKARIAGAGAAELAVLELYERTHKQRKTVLEAAQRRLKHLSPPDGA